MKAKSTAPSASGEVTSVADLASFEVKTYAKVGRRLIPFLMICYLGAYLDRVNVGFAKLQMLNDLRFSDTVYGIGAGFSSSVISSSRCRAISSCTNWAHAIGSPASC
jgi:sugar phosphate permease